MIGIPESAQKMTQGYPANYHTHTPRCHHAVGSEEEYIAFALERGLRILGFSDHTPYIFPDGYYSSFRMRPEEAEGYFETVRGLRDKYRGRLEIYAGLEAEYYPRHFGALLDLLRRFEPDYMILGQHCINNEYDGVYSGDPTDDERVLCRYVDQLIEAYETGCFTYSAHPDLIHYTGPEAIYEKHMLRLCESAKREDMPLEINMLGISARRNYPDERFWRIAAGVGCNAVIGSDAHKPSAVADPAALAKAEELATRCGIHVLETVELKKPV